jgi:hypothetical protein
MIILQMFGGEPRALSDAFYTDQPWRERKLILVSLKREADGDMYSRAVSWTLGSSDRLLAHPLFVLEEERRPRAICPVKVP